MKRTEVYIIRHGETEWNKIGKQQGHLNSDLTENGRQQAGAIAGFLEDDFDTIISSDLGRAACTAEIIGQKLSAALIYNAGLRERNLGIMQGLTKREFAERYPEEYEKFSGPDPDYIIPEGESARQRYTRVTAALDTVVSQYKNKKLLIIAHGGVLDSLFRYTLSIPLQMQRTFSLINGSINIFSHTGSWQLEMWGYTGHLRGLSALDDF
jgi:2,3-bisphosphoglycerate-dependent phosphoglycerate mutase